MSKTIKVKFTVTLNVDSDAWQANYGLEETTIREDIKAHFIGLCEENLESIGCKAKDPIKLSGWSNPTVMS